jgi:hypothetical protein
MPATQKSLPGKGGQFHTKEMLQESGKEKAAQMPQQNETSASAQEKNRTKLLSRAAMRQD